MHLQTNTDANSHFSQVPTIKYSRNAFSIAEKHVTTMQFDNLYPMYHKYIYPGDTLAITQKAMARLQTQIAPLYDDLYLDAHAWFVPMRLLQTNWARFQFNAQPAGPSQDNSSLTTPSINLSTLGSGGFLSKSIYDYFGFPTKINLTSSGHHINNYLARAYNLIWNDNYRDENLQNPVTVDLDEGPDNPTNYQILQSGKRFDKFTSCLTAQQKGPAVNIPIGTTAPVTGIGSFNTTPDTIGQAVFESNLTNPTYANSKSVNALLNDGTWFVKTGSGPSAGYPQIFADLSQTDGATVNQLRQSIAVQRLLEADARGGTRDVESIQHRWGVTVPDFRLQRPEWIGGTTWAFDGHIVPQTSETATTPQATLTQFSQAMNSFSVTHSFVEHGIFMILFRARSNMTYQQGLQREASYSTRFDFYQPEFANLGEVALLNKEIYCDGSANDDLTFGFQEYAYELRYSENRVSSEMRSNYATPLDSRHMADDYMSLPTLSSGWITNNTPISRNIAVSNTVSDPIQFNTLVQGRIARTLPMYSVPGLMRL